MDEIEPSNHRYLVADIGGTNTRVAISNGRNVVLESIRRYKNADASDVVDILRRFIAEQTSPDFDACCIAAAGPNKSGRIKMSNIGWVIDPAEIRNATNIQAVELLNDLQALGYSVDSLKSDALIPVVGGSNDKQLNTVQLVVGVGTGFNAASVHFPQDNQKLVTVSESGHISLPIGNEADLRLGKFASRSPGFAAVEDVLSGRGLEKIYAWLGEQSGQRLSKSASEICATLDGETDPQAIIAAGIFARILGTIVGDLALIHLPSGGIFFAGGVIRSFAPHLTKLGFTEAFRSKGRFEDHMLSYEIFVVDDDFAALNGCAAFLGTDKQAAR